MVTSKSLKLPSPAKINLFLHILRRREDGYHELQTLFQLLDFCDELHFQRRNDPQINLVHPIPEVHPDENLILKAAYLLQKYANISYGADISIFKQIPLGAGLGGGSSNAATALLGLNRLWNIGLDIPELMHLGLKLGSDVPVFINGHSAWGEGVGQHLQSLSLPPTWYVIIKPTVSVSTAVVFQHPHLARSTPPLGLDLSILSHTHNDCEAVVCDLYPEVKQALEWLSEFGSAKLTGTGSCVFLPINSRAEGEALLAKVPTPWVGFVTQGINLSLTHLALQ